MPLLTTGAGTFPAIGGGGGSILTFIDWNAATNNASSYNFASQPIGTADANRWVLVIVRPNNAQGTVTGVTIGGSAATLINAFGDTYLYGRNVTSGTTATIAVTLDSSTNNMTIHIYRLITATDPTSPFADDSDTILSGAPSFGITISSVPSGGAYLAWSLIDSTSDQACTWSGTASPSEQVETYPEGAQACNLSSALGTSAGTLAANWGAGDGRYGYVAFAP